MNEILCKKGASHKRERLKDMVKGRTFLRKVKFEFKVNKSVIFKSNYLQLSIILSR